MYVNGVHVYIRTYVVGVWNDCNIQILIYITDAHAVPGLLIHTYYQLVTFDFLCRPVHNYFLLTNVKHFIHASVLYVMCTKTIISAI